MYSTKRRFMYILATIFFYGGVCLLGKDESNLNVFPIEGILSTYVVFIYYANLRFRVDRKLLDFVFAISGVNILIAFTSIWENTWMFTNIIVIIMTLFHCWFQIQNYKKYQQELSTN